MTEVPLVSLTNMINGKSKVSKELIFDKSSNNKIWLVDKNLVV